MSGDCREQPTIFYSDQMTVTKMILLSKKGVTFKNHEYLLDILEEEYNVEC
jgi:hypothetical protein|tara:strand:+ start:331 stop:483 length:153 start_codon:yes stop_codon:yes gene_type:complete